MSRNTGRNPRLAGAATLALLLAACGSQTSEAGAAEEAGTADAQAAEAAAAAGPGETSAGTAGTAGGGLSAYLGKYPFEEVNGTAWNNNPTVLAAINRTVTDPAVREAILELDGPSAPIEMIRGKISAWACEVHNCGGHQWTVMIDPAGTSADICYFKEEQDSANSRWFLTGGTEEKRPGNCQVE